MVQDILNRALIWNETSFQIYVHQHDQQTHELIYITDLDTIILFSLSLKKVVENYLGAKKCETKTYGLRLKEYIFFMALFTPLRKFSN